MERLLIKMQEVSKILKFKEIKFWLILYTQVYDESIDCTLLTFTTEFSYLHISSLVKNKQYINMNWSKYLKWHFNKTKNIWQDYFREQLK